MSDESVDEVLPSSSRTGTKRRRSNRNTVSGHGKSRIADPWSDILNQMELSRALVDKSWNQSIVNRTKRITVLRERLSTLKGETTRFQQLTVDQKLQNQAMEVRLKHIKQYTQQKLALPRNQVMDSMAIDAE